MNGTQQQPNAYLTSSGVVFLLPSAELGGVVDTQAPIQIYIPDSAKEALFFPNMGGAMYHMRTNKLPYHIQYVPVLHPGLLHEQCSSLKSEVKKQLLMNKPRIPEKRPVSALAEQSNKSVQDNTMNEKCRSVIETKKEESVAKWLMATKSGICKVNDIHTEEFIIDVEIEIDDNQAVAVSKQSSPTKSIEKSPETKISVQSDNVNKKKSYKSSKRKPEKKKKINNLVNRALKDKEDNEFITDYAMDYYSVKNPRIGDEISLLLGDLMNNMTQDLI